MLPLTRIDPALLEKIVTSSGFARSERMSRFLRLLAERTGRQGDEKLKETEIGVLVFDREVGYDPKIDSIVRTEATRLRRKLKEYYEAEGRSDRIRLVLPPGRYELLLEPQEDQHPSDVVAGPETVVREKRGMRATWWWFAGSCVFVMLALALFLFRAGRVVHAALEVLPFTALPGDENFPSFSPDGRRIAFRWSGGEDAQSGIYVQSVGKDTAVALTRSPSSDLVPVWSQDGAEIAFLRRSGNLMELRIVRASGGPEMLIAQMRSSANNMPGLSWSPDGKWLASAAPVDTLGGKYRIMIIDRASRQMRVFLSDDATPSDRVMPAFSPDGRQIAFVETREVAVSDVYVAGFPNGAKRRLTFDGALIFGLGWAPDGQSLIVSSSRARDRASLWRVPLDGGPLVRLTEAAGGTVEPAVSSSTHTIAFVRRSEEINIWRRELNSRSSSDSASPWIVSTGRNSSPDFSPDGQQLVFRSSRTGTAEIWTSAAGRSPRRLTSFNGPLTGSPRWSPDGKWIAFDSRPDGKADIFIIASDGSGLRRLTTDRSNDVVPSWSRDGKFIYFTSDRLGGSSVWRQAVSGGAAELIQDHAFQLNESRDGRTFYYVRGPNEPGLWRRAAAGGPEENIVPDLRAGMWGNWALTRDAIYYAAPAASGSAQLMRFDLAARDAHPVFPIPRPIWWDGGLAISQDERWAMYANLDRSGSDIFTARLP